MEIFIIFLRTVFFYFFIFLVYRLMGKREVGQLGIIDLIVSILIAELTVISIENHDKSMFYSIIPIATLVVLEMGLAYISLKNPKSRIILDGNPSVIIKDGKLNYSEMIKQKYSLDDLLVQIRDKGYRSIEEIEYAILESNGTLSIFKNNETKTPFPLPLVLDGNIQEDTLKYLNKTKAWVNNMLVKRNIKIEDVFYAFYKNKNIFIIKNSDLM